MQHKDFIGGFIRLHILHHAAKGDVFGQWMIEELASHGYRLSPGTLYPMLHAMERSGHLLSTREQTGRTFRRVYRATPLGLEALDFARSKLKELFSELEPNP
jgi:DNA-binding PadR family transcriptional regulator